MSILEFLTAKPVLIGLHLGFAIFAIDLFLWLLGEMRHTERWGIRLRWIATLGTIGFSLSWIAGGYYYVKFYGAIVKPVIKSGLAPWAHTIIMETKEHAFLFLVPLAITAIAVTLLSHDELQQWKLRRPAFMLVGTIAVLSLSIGLMGFIISAAARWGVA